MNHTPLSATPEQRANLATVAKELRITRRRFDMGLTCGCVLGHAMRIHAPVGDIKGCGAFIWLFSAEWSRYDNTPTGAAARIEYALEKGIPDVPIGPEAVKLYQERVRCQCIVTKSVSPPSRSLPPSPAIRGRKH